MSPAPPVDLLARRTPLHETPRLGEAIGFAPGRLWMKRDDLTGIGGGGNKARKLEWLVADALRLGCDTLVTTGAIQSNHVRMTAAAATRFDLVAHGVLFGAAPPRPEGNVVLDDLLGLVAHVVSTRDDVVAEAERVAESLTEAGARPYLIPGGGSSAIGALGYVSAADEIRAAVDDRDPLLVCAVGTAGTYAGLAVGAGHHGSVLGVDVRAVPGIDHLVPALVEATAIAAERPAPEGTATVDPGQPEDYGLPTERTLEALRLVATTEGIILDPVYTGRAMAGLIDAARGGTVDPERTTVFVHTGGLPGLFVDRMTPWITAP